MGTVVTESAPVEPHVSLPNRPESRRGGAAILASCPSSSVPGILPAALLATTRVAEAVIRFGGMSILSVYGFPANHPDALFKNQALFLGLLEAISSSRLPVLIGGDFNCRVTALPCWTHYATKGFAELHALYECRFGQVLPMTCKEATAWDSLLVPSALLGLLVSATVDTEGFLFDAHSPVHVSFHAPCFCPATRKWRLPVSWAPLRPPASLVEQHYVALTSESPAHF